MITKIIIKNFKIHKYLEIPLSEGLNTILAPSDRGKSAIIQACRWLIENKPSGIGFRNWSCKEHDLVSVKFIFNNGDSITREKNGLSEKDGGIDRYILAVKDKESIFDRPNKNVPDEILRYLNLDYYNIKTQFSPFFLLQDSPGEVGRKFNDIVNLEIIDSVIKNAKSYVSKTKSEYEKSDEQVKKITKEIETLNYVEDLKKDIVLLEKDYFNWSERFESCKECAELIDGIYSIKNKSRSNEYLVSFEDEIDSLLDSIDVYNIRNTNVNNIIDLIREIEELEEDSEYDHKLVSFEEEMNNLILLNEELLNRNKRLEEIYDLIDDIELLNKKETRYENDLIESKIGYDESIKQGGICPTCKTKLTAKQLREIEL